MRRLTAAVLAVTGLGWAVPAGAASPAIHVTWDVTGNVVSCGGKELTAAGSFEIVLHEGSAPSGNESSTSTVRPNVTFLDPDENEYRLVGALRFGSTFNVRRETRVLVATEHFVLVSADGGVLGRISLTAHSSPNGKEFSLDMGTCV